MLVTNFSSLSLLRGPSSFSMHARTPCAENGPSRNLDGQPRAMSRLHIQRHFSRSRSPLVQALLRNVECIDHPTGARKDEESKRTKSSPLVAIGPLHSLRISERTPVQSYRAKYGVKEIGDCCGARKARTPLSLTCAKCKRACDGMQRRSDTDD